MARKKKEETVTSTEYYDIDFPESARAGRDKTPSPHEAAFMESYETQRPRGIPYDGTEEAFAQIKRDLERAKRHVGDLGMRGPVATVLESGQYVAVFQATPKREYKRSNGSEQASE